MARYICGICGYIYDESSGEPESGIAAGTRFQALPDDWLCPLCGAAKDEFYRDEDDDTFVEAVVVESVPIEGGKDYSTLEKHIICTNLGRGLEKQYQAEASRLFFQLADYYWQKREGVSDASPENIASLLADDKTTGWPAAQEAAVANGDRGAQRALKWNDKVSAIGRSLLTRYEAAGEALFATKNLYVCSACGFIYLGDAPPALCPVCKVPDWKFDLVKDGKAS